MAKKDDALERPWFTSPLFPLLMVAAGITALLLDGLTPFRVYHRRNSWTKVKGRLASSMQRRTKTRSSARGETRIEYLVKRTQRQIFSRVVTRGWPLKRKKKIYEIRITYTYPWKGKRFTKVSDNPGREFDSEKEARYYLGKRLKQGEIAIWVNPKNPTEATAFLDYPSTVVLGIGFALAALGLLWFVAALLLRRAHVRQETEKKL